MTSVSVSHPDGSDPPRGWLERGIFALVHLALPPAADNRNAAHYLWHTVGLQHPYIRWVVVRPESLIDEAEVSEYSLSANVTTSLFKPIQTTRTNVAHFMVALATGEASFSQWQGKMPMIHNKQA